MSNSNPPFFHPASMVDSNQIGDGTRIWAFTHVLKNVTIGANCNIGEQCFVESGAKIGDNVTLKNGNMVWEGVTLEDGVFVGPAVVFTNDLYPRSPRLPQVRERYTNHEWLVPTLVKHGASIGAGAIIIAGTTIGEFAMVGAGSVVTKDVPPHALVLGNPARVRGWVCQCGQRLVIDGQDATCTHCAAKYKIEGEVVTIIEE